MPFQLVPKSTTLDDLERPYRALLHKWCVFQSSSRKLSSRRWTTRILFKIAGVQRRP